MQRKPQNSGESSVVVKEDQQTRLKVSQLEAEEFLIENMHTFKMHINS